MKAKAQTKTLKVLCPKTYAPLKTTLINAQVNHRCQSNLDLILKSTRALTPRSEAAAMVLVINSWLILMI
jgi:SUMO ligase MMS21 Smc5/6 complex component